MTSKRHDIAVTLAKKNHIRKEDTLQYSCHARETKSVCGGPVRQTEAVTCNRFEVPTGHLGLHSPLNEAEASSFFPPLPHFLSVVYHTLIAVHKIGP